MSAVIKKIETILTNEYSTDNYVALTSEILEDMSIVAPYHKRGVPINFSSHIVSSAHVGNYIDPAGKKIIVLSVELGRGSYVENSRSIQRGFAKRLIENANADAALVAFYTEGDDRWRLSFVRLDYELKYDNGKMCTTENLTPARRYSFLVGKYEPCHTAIERFRAYLENHTSSPTLDDLENAFSVESVTSEFYDLYCDKYLELRECLENNNDFVEEAKTHNFTSEQFAKKLMGQIVFLYFLQKKGWLGVKAWPKKLNALEYKDALIARGNKSKELIPAIYKKVGKNEYVIDDDAVEKMSIEDETVLSSCVHGEAWGTGPRDFMRKLFEMSEREGTNFFDDYLEPLLYDALNVNRGDQGFDPALHCRIPFLSGGLFEPIDGYDWEHNRFEVPNELFSNKRNYKDRLANGILDIFDRYNFTMSEDEPLEREVAIDPEMLGKVFENMLDIKDRKSKGAYYTPREIVQYMCQESLISYLTNSLQVSESAIRDFILYGDLMRDEDADVLNRAEISGSYSLWISEELYELNNDGTIKLDRMEELDRALQNVRIADPAVGSGAFPLSMLNEIVRARQNITTYMDISQNILDPNDAARTIHFRRVNDRSARQLKYDTIRDCIFAVDNDPSAVDIAQLRLWLALVIDDEINPNATSLFEGHRNPLPLPNLECNILCGDSLVGEFEGIRLVDESLIIRRAGTTGQIQLNQRAIDTTLERLLQKQNELYKCDNTQKKPLILKEISDLRDGFIKLQLDGVNQDVIDRYEQAIRQASKPFILWALDFAKVFCEKGGFDIVIGNPPYIQLQKAISEDGDEKVGDIYKNLGYDTFSKSGDIYCLFYELGVRLLKHDGTITFITSNKWLKAAYGEELRDLLSHKCNPIVLIDFAGTRVFKAAGVDVSILLAIKQKNAGQARVCTVKDDFNGNVYEYVNNHAITTAFVSSDKWVILPLIEEQIRNKILKVGLPLKKWEIDIKYGIKTCLNSVYVINNETKEALCKEDPSSIEILTPVLRGKDIRKWGVNYCNLWLVSIHNGIHNYGIPPVDIEKYPAIKKYMDSHMDQLLRRNDYDRGVTPYHLKNCTYYELYSFPKILFQEIEQSPTFAFDAEGKYICLDTVRIITGKHLEYLTGLLNTDLFYFAVKHYFGGGMLGESGVRMKHTFFQTFTAYIPTPKEEEYIKELVVNEQCDRDEKINQFFYQKYGITDEEKKYIEDDIY